MGGISSSATSNNRDKKLNAPNDLAVPESPDWRKPNPLAELAWEHSRAAEFYRA
jgi:hypothetical protein